MENLFTMWGWMSRNNLRGLMVLICVLLATITAIPFAQLLKHGFLVYDDPQYVTTNPHVLNGLTWEGFKWSFQGTYAENWHPLTWLSHMLDVTLFGLNPGLHHFTNLLLHIANCVLIFLVLKGMTHTLWRSAMVAALFAIHPLHVESVAWIAERKDVLSGFFFMLTLLAYQKYVSIVTPQAKFSGSRKSEANAQGRKFPFLTSKFYILAVILFGCGLMSKPMLVTLPCVLLLLDYWPLDRFKVSSSGFNTTAILRLIIEKIPFFALAGFSCLKTVLAQKPAMVDTRIFPFATRVGNATVAYTDYLCQTFWPTRLAIFYPYQVSLPVTKIAVSILVLAIITSTVVFLAKNKPYLMVGWFWYLGMLVPVIGVVQVGLQERADRYTYLPLIGVFVAIVWTLGSLALTLPRRRWLTSSFCAVTLALLTLISYRQVGYWKNNESVFSHAAEVTKNNYLAWNCLGISALLRSDIAAALADLDKALGYAEDIGATGGTKYYIGAALQMQGKMAEALPYLRDSEVAQTQLSDKNYRLAMSFLQIGEMEQARAALEKALREKPQDPDYRLGEAALLLREGSTNQAEQIFRRIVQTNPKLVTAHRLLADFLVLQGNLPEAATQYAIAVDLQPNAALRRAYAPILARLGKEEEAIVQLKEALSADPKDAAVNFELAEMLSQAGHDTQAVICYEKILSSHPDDIGVLNNLAWILATSSEQKLRDGQRAVELATRACQITDWKSAFLIGTLAAAYAESGSFSNAIAIGEKARDIARNGNLEEVAKRNESLIALYRAGKPYREQIINTNKPK